MNCDVGEVTKSLENELSFPNPSVALPTSRLILQPFRRFTYVPTHSSTLPSLYLRHNSFPNLSVALPTSQLILQPFRCFTYVTTHSPTLPLLYLRHNSFSNPSVALPISQLILQPFHCFTYVTAHSPTLPLLHLHHSSFHNPSFASPTSQDLHLIHLASRLCQVVFRPCAATVNNHDIGKPIYEQSHMRFSHSS